MKFIIYSIVRILGAPFVIFVEKITASSRLAESSGRRRNYTVRSAEVQSKDTVESSVEIFKITSRIGHFLGVRDVCNNYNNGGRRALIW